MDKQAKMQEIRAIADKWWKTPSFSADDALKEIKKLVVDEPRDGRII